MEWADVSVVILGKTITNIQSVKYGGEQEKTLIYGRGNAPLSIQSGQKKFEGEIMLLQSELDELVVVAKAVNPKYSVTDISFDIVVSYGVGNESKRDIIRSAQISEWEKGMKSEDSYMEITLPFLALGIDEAV